MSEPSGALQGYRDEIDELDDAILNAIAQRLEVCRNVARFKRVEGLPMMQPERIDAVLERCAALGSARQIDPAFTKKLYRLIIEETCSIEDAIIRGDGVTP